MDLLRRVRAALGIGLVWAVGWGVAGAVSFTLFWQALAPYQQARLVDYIGVTLDFRVAATLGSSALGFAGGIVLSLLLSVIERRRSMESLSIGRVAALGAAAGFATSAVAALLLGGVGAVAAFAAPAGVVAAFGAAAAGTTLHLARRASRDDEIARVTTSPGIDRTLASNGP